MPDTYPPPHIKPPPPPAPYDDLDGFFEVVDVDGLIAHAQGVEQQQQSQPHTDTTPLEQEENASPQAVGHQNVFTDEQRSIMHQFSDETPSAMMVRLRSHDPTMQQTYKQVKAAIGNERRKKNKQRPKGQWTHEELEIILHNIDLSPAQLEELLKFGIPACKKNEGQIRAMQAQLSIRIEE